MPGALGVCRLFAFCFVRAIALILRELARGNAKEQIFIRMRYEDFRSVRTEMTETSDGCEEKNEARSPVCVACVFNVLRAINLVWHSQANREGLSLPLAVLPANSSLMILACSNRVWISSVRSKSAIKARASFSFMFRLLAPAPFLLTLFYLSLLGFVRAVFWALFTL